MAELFLKENGATVEIIAAVKDCIKVTQMPQQPTNL